MANEKDSKAALRMPVGARSAPQPETQDVAGPSVEPAPKGITQYGDRRRSYFRKRDYSS